MSRHYMILFWSERGFYETLCHHTSHPLTQPSLLLRPVLTSQPLVLHSLGTPSPGVTTQSRKDPLLNLGVCPPDPAPVPTVFVSETNVVWNWDAGHPGGLGRRVGGGGPESEEARVVWTCRTVTPTHPYPLSTTRGVTFSGYDPWHVVAAPLPS